MSYMDINPEWDVETANNEVKKFVKSLICKNLEIPIDVPNENTYEGLQWPINYSIIKKILDILTNIDVRHWKKLTYASYRTTGVYSWKTTPYGQYELALIKSPNVDKKISFRYLTIIISKDYISITSIVYNHITNKTETKRFNNGKDFVGYYRVTLTEKQ